jgi:hypothetical protein
MSFKYKDFFPEVLRSGLFSTEYEALTDTVSRANRWVEACRVQVINLETVVLPNIDGAEDASQAASITIRRSDNDWYQVVRVWYKIEASNNPDPGTPD